MFNYPFQHNVPYPSNKDLDTRKTTSKTYHATPPPLEIITQRWGQLMKMLYELQRMNAWIKHYSWAVSKTPRVVVVWAVTVVLPHKSFNTGYSILCVNRFCSYIHILSCDFNCQMTLTLIFLFWKKSNIGQNSDWWTDFIHTHT